MKVLKKHVQQLTTARNDLINARTLIQQPGSWTKGAFARTDSGNLIDAKSRNATCFCAEGALIHAQGAPDSSAMHESLAHAYLNHVMAPSNGDIEDDTFVVGRNDLSRTTHRQILMHFDMAIVLVEDELAFAQKRVSQ